MNILSLLQEFGITPRKASTAKGGEYHSPCPGCGGNDRFHSWPAQGECGTFWCRQCDKGGDAIQFLREFKGLDYHAACDYLGISPKEYGTGDGKKKVGIPRSPLPPKEPVVAAFVPDTHGRPNPRWVEHATKFAHWAHEQLLANPEQLAYLAARGIDYATVCRFGIGYNPGDENGRDRYRNRESWGLPPEKDENTGKLRNLWLPVGIVITTWVGNEAWRIRIRRPKPVSFGPDYQRLPGGSNRTMVLNEKAEAFVITEAELDGYACVAQAGDLIGAIPVQSVEGKPDREATELLRSALCILNALDFGDEGKGKQAVLRAVKWWADTFPLSQRRWPVPVGKDPGEAFAEGINLRALILAGLPPRFQVRAALASGRGGSVFSGAKEKGDNEPVVAEVREQPAGPEVAEEPAVAESKPARPVEVEELAALLRGVPVSINKEDELGEIKIDWKRDWQGEHPEQAARISALVFGSDTVGDWLARHPARRVHGGNLLALPAEK